MRLFMDISAAYISKLSDYRKLVSRKIKANQTADLLKTLNTHKMEEEESQMFYNRFDKAFMELYPGFVTELNKLLLPECQLELPDYPHPDHGNPYLCIDATRRNRQPGDSHPAVLFHPDHLQL